MVRLKRKLKLLIVTPVMHMGGAERCVANLLRHLDRECFAVDLVMVFDREIFYPIPSDVWTHILEHDPLPHVPSVMVEIPLHLLGAREDLTWLKLTAMKLADVVRRRQPDVVLARHLFSSVLCCISRKYWPREVRLVVSADNHVSTMLSRTPQGPVYSYLIRAHFGRTEKVVSLSHGVADDLVNNFKVPRDKIVVIPNPVDFEEITLLAEESLNHAWFSEQVPILVSMGRLVPQKGFNYLLRAFSLIHREGIQARLVLIGDGEGRHELENLATQLGVAQHVWFAGKQRNPFKYITRSTVFVLSSLHEGFANVVAEALACGCPVVSTDCPSGPAEILDNGRYGLLVPVADEQALATAIIKILRDSTLRQYLAEQGKKRAQDFEARKVTGHYKKVLLEAFRKFR